MVEKLLLVVIVLQIGLWIIDRLRERRFRRDVARTVERIAETGIEATERQAGDLSRQLTYIATQMDWVADRVSELRLEQLEPQPEEPPVDRPEGASVDHLKDYPAAREDG